MNIKRYDVGIVGAGVAGAFAALRISEKYRDTQAILFELGKKPGKRRRQIEGWFGCFPTGDGKIYINDSAKVANVIDGRRAAGSLRWFKNHLEEVAFNKIIKDKNPAPEVLKRLKEHNWDIQLNDYIQWKPDNIHALSKIVAEQIEAAGNVEFSFDNEVFDIIKNKRTFIITTSLGDYQCKRIILCVGRSGWRWATKLYRELGITANDDFANFGMRIEMPAQFMKEFNRSHCTISKDDITMGPLCWNGTVIPEDHADLVIASFRSNEDRWKSDKVSFSLTGSKFFKGNGCVQADRLGKLAFLLSNDRVGRERIKTFLRGQSQLSLLPEYSWLKETLQDLTKIIPNILNKGYFHVPNIIPMASSIRLGPNLESEVIGLFVAGESAGLRGICASGISGAVAADGACK